ncbi:hypothetical protein OGATHE_001699 [Ogataea polymorpha]|uniref:Uncharacterized protein n=1 Tax=Ogataea polymorpha TaxID=460523 RepID=A0A9P8PQ93_9ASCO|nr:hypothetical protein OGATHE_001699 [Ogataea polymorpha]
MHSVQRAGNDERVHLYAVQINVVEQLASLCTDPHIRRLWDERRSKLCCAETGFPVVVAQNIEFHAKIPRRPDIPHSHSRGRAHACVVRPVQRTAADLRRRTVVVLVVLARKPIVALNRNPWEAVGAPVAAHLARRVLEGVQNHRKPLVVVLHAKHVALAQRLAREPERHAVPNQRDPRLLAMDLEVDNRLKRVGVLK